MVLFLMTISAVLIGYGYHQPDANALARLKRNSSPWPQHSLDEQTKY